MSNLKPIGELKVTTIPFGGPEHYGLKYQTPRRMTKFEEELNLQGRMGNKSEPVITDKEEREKETISKETDMSNKTSHVIIGLSILILMIFISYKFSPPQ